jgi:starvation-inducible outer membrane lipoprotein
MEALDMEKLQNAIILLIVFSLIFSGCTSAPQQTQETGPSTE